MRFSKYVPVAIVFCLGLFASPARAQTAEDLTQDWFYAQTETARAAALAGLEAAAAGDNTAHFGRASIAFFDTVEGLMQDLHRYGYDFPRSGFVSELQFAIPENPSPETLTYEGFRDLLERFVSGMERSRVLLGEVDGTVPVAIGIDFGEARMNVVGGETIASRATLAGIFAQMQPRRPRPRNQDGKPAPTPPPPVFRFDNADAIWLEGYANLVLAQAEFLLAHDFRRAFDNSFQLFFPRAGLPMQKELPPPASASDMRAGRASSAGWVADLISFVHLSDWPVIDRDRRAGYLDRMHEVARLSRANWAAIKAETDNDHEWLPGPHQPGIHPLSGIEVTDKVVDGWMRTLDLLDAVLDGDRLVPHWRFPARGIDIRAFFESGEDFDPVLLVTGPGALPFLKTGDVIDAGEWREIRTLVGRRSFFMTAAWFN